jgi:hypothetical protein
MRLVVEYKSKEQVMREERVTVQATTADTWHSASPSPTLSPYLSSQHISPFRTTITPFTTTQAMETMSEDSDEPYVPTGLLDLPNEVLLDYLLPALPVKDLVRMSRVSKFFYELCVSPRI